MMRPLARVRASGARLILQTEETGLVCAPKSYRGSRQTA